MVMSKDILLDILLDKLSDKLWDILWDILWDKKLELESKKRKKDVVVQKI